MAQLSITAAVATDVGRSRATNEDWAIAKQLTTGRQQELGPVWLAAVADGMGGHAAGEVASRVAIATLEGALGPALRHAEKAADFQAALLHAFGAAHAAVQARAGALSEDGNMGTTLTAALAVGNHLWIAHVGDSRAYLLRNGGVEQLTEDQAIPPNRLTQALGMGGSDIVPDLFSRDLQEGDAVLLTSDGLHTTLRPRDLHLAVRTSPDAHTACQKLAAAARLRDGSDNITVACLAAGRAFGRRRRTRRRRLVLGTTLTTVLAGIALVGWLMTKQSPPLGAGAGNVRVDLHVENGKVFAALVPDEPSGGPPLSVRGQRVPRSGLPLGGAPHQWVTLVVEAVPGGAYRWILGRERGTKRPTGPGRGVTVDQSSPSTGTEFQGTPPPGCDHMELYTEDIGHRPTRVAFYLAGPGGRDVPVVLDLTSQAAEPAATLAEPTRPKPGAHNAYDSRAARRPVVPLVRGFTQTVAEAKLQSAGAKPIRVLYVHGPEPKGRALKTEPPAGSPMPPNGRVTLTVSEGPPPAEPKPVKVPLVLGVPVEQARRLLTKAGLRSQAREVDDPGPRGTVVGRTPAAAEVPSGTAITLLTSKGPSKEPAGSGLRNVMGWTVAKAREQLRKDGLQPVVAGEASDEAKVTGTEPAAGTVVKPEETITLIVTTASSPDGGPQ